METVTLLRQAQKPDKNMSEKEVFSTVLLHCLLIIISPILTFFVFNFWIFASLGFEPVSNNIYSAFAAVIVLHLALGNLIYRAYFNTEVVPGFDKTVKED